MPANKFYIKVILWRIFLLLVVFIAAKSFLYRDFLFYTGVENIVSTHSPLNEKLLLPWANFDGVHYLMIASDGYIDQQRFLPLFPFVLRAFVSIFGFLGIEAKTFSQTYFITGLILNTALFLGSLSIFHKLTKLDFKSQEVSKILLLLIFFPTSFFFSAIYSESLFLFLSLASLLFARQRKWVPMWITAGLLTVTRLSGVLILPALIWEVWLKNNFKNIKNLLNVLIGLIVSVTPILVYTYYNYITWGDPFYFIHAHADLGNSRSASSIIFPGITIFRYIKIALTAAFSSYEYWLALLEVIVFGVVGWLLYLGFKLKIRTSYMIFGTLVWLLPSLSGTFSGMPRYAILVLPVYFVLAKIIPNRIFTPILVTLAILQVILLTLFSRGYLIG